GHLLDPRPAGAAVQAGAADDPGTVRGTARADRGRDRRRRGGGPAQPRKRPRGPAVSARPVRGAGGQAGLTAARPAVPRPAASGPAASGLATGPGAAAAPGPAAPGPAAVTGEPAAGTAAATWRARQMLARAHWAAGAFACYDRASVLRIAEAVATAAHEQARRYAEWAVAETGFGVVEHKIVKNEACSLGILERYAGDDYVSPRIDTAGKILSLPRPAGVILALTPSTNPVCSVFFKVILALLTRNAIVVSPHPMAQGCCADAARLLAAVATEA